MKKYIPTIRRASGALVIFVLFVLLQWCANYFMADSSNVQIDSGFWSKRFVDGMIYIYSLFALFVIVNNFTLYNETYKKRAVKELRKDSGLLEKCHFIVSSCEFLTQLTVLSVLLSLMPSYSTYYYLLESMLGVASWYLFLARLLLMLATVIFVFVAVFLGHLVTVNFFAANAAKESARQLSWNIPPFVKLAAHIFINSLLFIFVSSMIVVAVGAIITIRKILRLIMVALIIILALAVVVIYSYRILRLYFKRREFARSFKAICEKNGFEVNTERSFYRSLFSANEGYDFKLRTRDGVYCCKFVTSKRRGDTLRFGEDGQVSYTKYWFLFARHIVSEKYFFEGEGEKIVIVNPVPRTIYFQAGGYERILEVGDKICGYSVFNSSGFLGALRRDCLKRAVKKDF